MGIVTRTVRTHVHETDRLHRRLADQGLPLQTFGQGIAVDEGTSGRGSVTAEDIPLTLVRLDGVNVWNQVDLLRRHRPHALWHYGLRNATVENRSAIGSTTELVAGIVITVAPGIVGELMQKLQGAAVGLEAIGPHLHVEGFAPHRAFESGVTDTTVDPVVIAVVQIARLGV